MLDPFEQLDKVYSKKIFSQLEQEESYVRSLVDTFSKNENYALILGASLSILFKNLHKGKRKTKDSIKVDFFNFVKAYTEPFSFDPIADTSKDKVAFDLYIIDLQIVSRLELVDGISIDFRNFDEKMTTFIWWLNLQDYVLLKKVMILHLMVSFLILCQISSILKILNIKISS